MAFGIISSTSFAGTLVINTDTSDAAPKEAFVHLKLCLFLVAMFGLKM